MSPTARVRALGDLARSRVARNALALYGVGFTSYLFPLVTAPYLARVLQPAGWGRVALAQSLGQSLAVVVEYGFMLSATREVARAAPIVRAEVLASVVGAKAVLAAAVLAIAAVAGVGVPAIVDHRLYWCAIAWAVGQGFHPLWYYQASEQVRRLLVLDLLANACAVAGVLTFCAAPEDAWKVLALQAAAAVFVALAGHALALVELPVRLPSLRAVRARLANGAALFAYRLAVSAYTVANPFVLGLLAPPVTVGYFAAAEKIVKPIFVAAIHPLNQALYPHASRLGGSGPVITRAIRLFAIAGSVAGAAVFLAAPRLVPLVFGADYAPAILPLRILALLLPILSVSTALVMHRMLPVGHDHLLLAITIAAGAVNVALAIALAPAYGEAGMATAVVTVEAGVLVAIVAAVRRRR